MIPTLCIHDLCDLPGFKNQEVKWEVLRQIKAHWKIIHRNIHNLKLRPKSELQTSEPAGGREKVSACEKPSPALHFLWQAITCTPAWEEKFVRDLPANN